MLLHLSIETSLLLHTMGAIRVLNIISVVLHVQQNSLIRSSVLHVHSSCRGSFLSYKLSFKMVISCNSCAAVL